MTLVEKCLKQINKNINSFILLSLIIVAFLYRLTPVLAVAGSLMSDDAMYMSMARSFYEGNLNAIIHPFWMPFYPFVSAVFFRFVQNWSFASILTSAVSGAALVIPVYFTGKYFAGRMVGLLTAILLIPFFPLVYASYTPYAESLQVFLFWAGIAFYLKAIDSNKAVFALLSGFFWGLTFLTRSEGLFTVVGLLIFNFLILGLLIRKRIRAFDSFLKAFLLFISFLYLIINYPYLGINGFLSIVIFVLFSLFLILLLFSTNFETRTNIYNLLKSTFLSILVILIFYFLYNGALIVKYQKPLFSAKASAFLNPGGYYTLNKEGTSTWGQDVVLPETFNPDSEFVKSTFMQARIFNKQNIVPGVLENTFFLLGRFLYFNSKASLVLFFIGIYWLIFKTKDYSRKIFLFSMTLPSIFLLSIISIDTSERYLYFASPIISLSIALGVNYLSSFFKSKKLRISVFLILAFLAYYFTLSHLSSRGKSLSFSFEFSEYVSLFTGEKARFYNQDNTMIDLLKDKRIMGRHEGLGFNNRALFIYSPTVVNIDQFLNYAKRWKVDYVVAGATDIDNRLNFLYTSPKDYPGLKLNSELETNSYLYKIIY